MDIDLGKDLEETIPTDHIESLCEVYEGEKEWLPLLPTFFLKLPCKNTRSET